MLTQEFTKGNQIPIRNTPNEGPVKALVLATPKATMSPRADAKKDIPIASVPHNTVSPEYNKRQVMTHQIS